MTLVGQPRCDRSRPAGPRSSPACPGSRSPASRRGSTGHSPRPRSSRRPTRCGGRQRGRHASQSGKLRPSSSQPPSTQAIPRIAAGWRAASSSTTLPPHDWPATTGRSSSSRVDQPGEVAGDGRRRHSRRRACRRPAVAAQVDRRDRVPELGQPAGDAVPQPGVRGQPVDEDERRGALLRPVGLPPIDHEIDIVGDRDPLRPHGSMVRPARDDDRRRRSGRERRRRTGALRDPQVSLRSAPMREDRRSGAVSSRGDEPVFDVPQLGRRRWVPEQVLDLGRVAPDLVAVVQGDLDVLLDVDAPGPCRPPGAGRTA